MLESGYITVIVENWLPNQSGRIIISPEDSEKPLTDLKTG